MKTVYPCCPIPVTHASSPTHGTAIDLSSLLCLAAASQRYLTSQLSVAQCVAPVGNDRTSPPRLHTELGTANLVDGWLSSHGVLLSGGIPSVECSAWDAQRAVGLQQRAMPYTLYPPAASHARWHLSPTAVSCPHRLRLKGTWGRAARDWTSAQPENTSTELRIRI